jgi:cytochrome P450
MATTDPVQFHPLLPEVIEDPYPLYHRLRADDPVHQNPAGMWMLSRYDDVSRFLRIHASAAGASRRSSPHALEGPDSGAPCSCRTPRTTRGCAAS